MIHNTISSPPLQCSLTWDSLVSCFVEKTKETAQCFWMLPVFWNCDLRNKPSLHNHRQMSLNKIKLYHKLSGYSQVLYSQNKHKNGVAATVRPPPWPDYMLQGIYHQGLKRLKAPLTPAGAAHATQHMTERPCISPFCPHHHGRHICILSR